MRRRPTWSGPRRGTSLRCCGRSAGDSSPVTSDGAVGPGDARDRPHPVETVAPGEARPARCRRAAHRARNLAAKAARRAPSGRRQPSAVRTAARRTDAGATGAGRRPRPRARGCPPPDNLRASGAIPPAPPPRRRRCPDAGAESQGPRCRPHPPRGRRPGALRYGDGGVRAPWGGTGAERGTGVALRRSRQAVQPFPLMAGQYLQSPGHPAPHRDGRPEPVPYSRHFGSERSSRCSSAAPWPPSPRRPP